MSYFVFYKFFFLDLFFSTNTHRTALQASPYNVTDFSALDKAVSEDLLETMKVFVYYYIGRSCKVIEKTINYVKFYMP